VYISHLPEADDMNATFLHLKVKPVGSLWGRTLDQIFTSGMQLDNLEIPRSQYIKHHLNDLGQHLIPTVLRNSSIHNSISGAMCDAKVMANPNRGVDNVTRQPERKVQKSASTQKQKR
jgi:hypothetical protein